MPLPGGQRNGSVVGPLSGGSTLPTRDLGFRVLTSKGTDWFTGAFENVLRQKVKGREDGKK